LTGLLLVCFVNLSSQCGIHSCIYMALEENGEYEYAY